MKEYNFWIPNECAKEDIYIVKSDPDMLEYYEEEMLYEILKTQCDDPTISPLQDHITLVAPPRTSKEVITMLFTVSKEFELFLKSRSPPYICYNIGGATKWKRASEVQASAESTELLKSLTLENNN